jgi:hypothetical protein
MSIKRPSAPEADPEARTAACAMPDLPHAFDQTRFKARSHQRRKHGFDHGDTGQKGRTDSSCVAQVALVHPFVVLSMPTRRSLR